jgi:dethiobiotin synthetase
MTRPNFLVAVAGTGTEIGKTWTTCRLVETAIQRGLRVAARKPVQSFNAGEVTDADQLATASHEAPHDVCPEHRWYPIAMAPPMAADVLGREQISLADLLHETIWPAQLDIGFIETAGGLRSPIAHNADNLELIRRAVVDEILLVADAGLGTINSVRLSLDALHGHRVRIFLNRFDSNNDLHVRNHRWLVDSCGCDAFYRLEDWFERR